MSDIILPRRSQVYKPGDRAYRGSLLEELKEEKVRLELAFVRLENLVKGSPGLGNFKLSSIYPNIELESQGYEVVQNYIDCDDCVIEVASAPWTDRCEFKVILYKDVLWLFGGRSASYTYYNDVWASQDGVNWILVESAAPWDARAGISAEVVNNGTDDGILMAGGYDAGTAFTDAWLMFWDGTWPPVSGVNQEWVQSSTDIKLIKPERCTTVIFKNQLFMFGSEEPGSSQISRTVFGPNVGYVWEELPETGFSFRRSVAWADENLMYVGLGDSDGGPNLSIRTTSDGITWTGRVPMFPALLFMSGGTAIKYNDNIILIGGIGYGGEGQAWISLIPPFYDRGDYGRPRLNYFLPYYQKAPVVVFNNRIWLFGNAYINETEISGVQDVISFVPKLSPIITPEGFYLYRKV